MLLFTKSSTTRKKYEDKKLLKNRWSANTILRLCKISRGDTTQQINIETHIEAKTTACKKLMVMLNSNLRGVHTPKPKLSKWAYTGVVRTKLLYACMTWGNSITTIQQFKKLKGLDRLAVRSTTTITTNTPQASVENMIDLMPIELMIQKMDISAYIRLKRQFSVPFQATGKMVSTLCVT